MKKQLDIIQVFRGLAAFFVVIHHVVPSLSYFQNVQFPFLNYLASMGKYGVDFFFILSGFIINYANAFKKEKNIPKFIKNRIIRIYIPYLPIGISLYFLYLLVPSLSESSRDISTITSFTLFPAGNPALAVAWTLSFELFFYLIYTICILNKKIWNLLIVIWTVAIVTINYNGIQFESAFLQLVFSYYNLHFLLGYILSLLLINQVILNKGGVAFAIITFFVVFCLSKYFTYSPHIFFSNSIFGIFAFFLIYYFVSFRNIKLSSTSIFMMIGNSSYSLYLVHGPLHSFIERFLPLNSSVWIFMLYILSVSTVCIFAGYIYYLLFEKKAINLFKKI